MPIRSVCTINPLTLADIKYHIPGFTAPQLYYILDNNLELLQLIESKIQPITDCVYNSIEISVEAE